MSDKHNATWHGGEPPTEVIAADSVEFPLPQRIPFEALAQLDHTAPEPRTDERPWVSPGRPPWVNARRREPLLFPATKIWTDATSPLTPPPPPPLPTGPKPQWPLAIVVAVLVAVVVILAVAVRSQNVAPAWVPLIGMDSGVAACRAISESDGREIKTEGTTPEQMAAIRQMFADSRYPSIEVNGVALMDIAAQAERLGDDLAVLALITPMVTAYAGLAGGCSEQGYPLPPLARS